MKYTNRNLRNRTLSTTYKPYNKGNAKRIKTKETETNRNTGKTNGVNENVLETYNTV